MKLGVCTNPENLQQIQQAGYDYIEPALFQLEKLTDEAFEQVKISFKSASIQAEVFNCFIPGEIPVVGEAVNEGKIDRYLKRALYRASQLGAQVIVFGSGGARNIPEGFSRKKAMEQLTDFLTHVSDVLQSYDITVVIEPLNQKECNVLNSVKEALVLAKAVNRSNIRVLADLYHMACEDEDMGHIREAGNEYLKHLHIANPEGRVYPKLGDKYPYIDYFSALKDIDYKGRLSVEGSAGDFKKDLEESLIFLKDWVW